MSSGVVYWESGVSKDSIDDASWVSWVTKESIDCLKVHFQESSGVVGLSSRVEAKDYGPKNQVLDGLVSWLTRNPILGTLLVPKFYLLKS